MEEDNEVIEQEEHDILDDDKQVDEELIEHIGNMEVMTPEEETSSVGSVREPKYFKKYAKLYSVCRSGRSSLDHEQNCYDS